jgi:hypothetical protein
VQPYCKACITVTVEDSVGSPDRASPRYRDPMSGPAFEILLQCNCVICESLVGSIWRRSPSLDLNLTDDGEYIADDRGQSLDPAIGARRAASLANCNERRELQAADLDGGRNLAALPPRFPRRTRGRNQGP